MRFLRCVLCAVLSVSLVPAAMAKDKDHDKGHDKDRGHHAIARNSSRPPGWDKGKKTGWNGRNVPPGQAKKSHSHAVRHDRDRDHDRDDATPAPGRRTGRNARGRR